MRVFTQTFGVVGAIIEQDGQILLVREADRKGPDAGKWSQPAGWIEVGESPVAAVIRETKEESGFDFEPTGIVGIYSLVRSDISEQLGGTPHAIKIIFKGKISGQADRLANDISESRWFAPEEIYSMDNHALRDPDIKQEVKDYFDGRDYPLALLTHTVAA